ncbi:TPA: ISL3 family transposase, partial [Streptococcus pyogenes]|nr:ISL3 family transposase [Streptococcus pyogenes]
CGFPTVNKDGFRKTHVRLASLNGRRYELELRKQRYKCKSCHTTFGAITNLTKENQTLSSDLKNQIMLLARKGLSGQLIAEMCHCSPSSVRRTILERMEPHYRVAKLPKHLCFDEFRSIKSVMSFICCDAETHQIVTKLQDRLSPTIVDYFESRYSKAERECVQSVVIDLNAQYQSFIYRLFPNANIIIDRFHLVQLAGRALDNCRISILKQLDKQSQEYKIMKSHWKLFHKKAEDLHPEEVVFLRGVKQYMTRQNAVDLITSKFSKFAEVYQTYQDITKALNERNSELLESTILDYQKTNTEMDTAIQTLRQNRKYVLNSAKFEYSNGPLEGINRKIKTLKRTCYGFANQKFFFLRIDCIFS